MCMYACIHVSILQKPTTRADLPCQHRWMKHVGVDVALARIVCTLVHIQALEFRGAELLAHGIPIGEHLWRSRNRITGIWWDDKSSDGVC